MNDSDVDEPCTVDVRGPYFDELVIGDYPTAAPGLTLSSGLAAQHRAVVGDRMPLALDDTLASEVVGAAPLADPALVWDVAIGQSTLVTQNVIANLFYRAIRFHRLPVLGDTLRTRVRVDGLRTNRERPQRAPTGMAALHVTTVDQCDRVVLDFWRCAMLPVNPNARSTPVRADDLDQFGTSVDLWTMPNFVGNWRLERLAGVVPAVDVDLVRAPATLRIRGGDVVSSAPELARLSLNVATVHHDRLAAGGRRLVYGGHAVGIALSQAGRALPSMITVMGWRSCDHLGPVYEGDTLFSTIEISRYAMPRELWGNAVLADLRSRVTAVGSDALAAEARPVLDWKFVALLHSEDAGRPSEARP